MLQSAPSVLAPACCPDEEWRRLPGWPHEVSSCGRMRSITRTDAAGRLRLGAVLSQRPDRRKGKGYLYADLLDGQRRRKVHVAVAVLEAFTEGKPSPAHEAGHENGIRTDNHRRNLEWVTRPQNRAKREEHRRARSVTAQNGKNRANLDRTDGYLSQNAGFPRKLRHRSSVTASVTSANSRGTGSFPFLPHFPSFPLSLNPSILRPLRGLRPRPKDSA